MILISFQGNKKFVTAVDFEAKQFKCYNYQVVRGVAKVQEVFIWGNVCRLLLKKVDLD